MVTCKHLQVDIKCKSTKSIKAEQQKYHNARKYAVFIGFIQITVNLYIYTFMYNTYIIYN